MVGAKTSPASRRSKRIHLLPWALAACFGVASKYASARGFARLHCIWTSLRGRLRGASCFWGGHRGSGVGLIGVAGVSFVLAATLAQSALAKDAHPQAPATVERVRYEVGGSSVRVIVRLSRRVPYDLTALAAGQGHMPRLVIDLSNARLGDRAREAEGEIAGALLAFRTGQFNPRTARVVLEMEKIGAYAAVIHDGPPRLVVDVEVLALETRRQPEKTARPDPVRAPRRSGEKEGAKPATRVKETAQGGNRAAAKATSSPAIVVIDPGHGGEDPGAVGRGGLTEKEVTLAVSRRLAAKLEANPSLRVFLTRESDVTVPLRKRTSFANAHHADLFISIHTNADDAGRLSGVETYYLNNADDHATIRLAAQENGLAPPGANLPVDRDVLYIVSDLVQSGKEEESIELARLVQTSLTRRLASRRHKVNNLGVKKGPFFVLTGAYMPCVLVEVSFLSNPKEGRLLAAAWYQDAIAEGIYRGIIEFLSSSRVAETL